MAHSRFKVGGAILLGIFLAFVGGCGADPFIPAAPPELVDSGPVAASQPPRLETAPAPDDPPGVGVGGRVVELILSRPPNSDEVYFGQILRQKTGRARRSFRSFAPTADEPRPVDWTVKTIQAAVAMNAAGILVKVDPDPAVLAALAQARARGLAVLVLETPLPVADGKPFPVVTYGSFEEPGRKIVQTLLDAALNFPDFQSTRILVVDNKAAGAFRERRLESLTAPLRSLARKWDLVQFDGTEIDAQRQLNKALSRPGPRVSVVIAQEDLGLYTAYRALLSREEQNQPEFLLGGYFSYDFRSGTDMFDKLIVFGDRAVGDFAAKAFESMMNMIEGKSVPNLIEVPIAVHTAKTFFVPKSPPTEKP